ncbi:MAG: 50S ribosomal protein L25/general stress protein Ctc [Rickettsiaceae bacterium]|nr:MAG: 50S ribosomal protein L25/general stress protein Ctc [Rickettsiaceae bacterium]
MSEALQITAITRQMVGTGSARAVRRLGLIPAVIYGKGRTPSSVAVQEKEIMKIYRKPNFISTLIEMDIEGQKYRVLPKAVQLHPVTDIVNHIDFVFVGNQSQKMELPIFFEGKDKSLGIKRGGYFNPVKRSLFLECLVDNLPRRVVIDVSSMLIGQSIKSHNITLPEGCQLIDKSNFVIASIIGRAGKADAEEQAK